MKYIIFYTRVILILLFISIAGVIGTVISITRPFNPKNLKITAKIFSFGTYILGLKVVVRNPQLIDEHPCVIVSNHQENMDLFIGATVLPYNTVTIGKRSILYIPFFGIFYWLSGNILINRSNKKSAFGTIDEAAKKIVQNKISVWILAEGTRSKGRGVLPFKKGAFITALKAQVPIFPVAISSYKNEINLSRFHAGTVIVEMLPKIETKNLANDDINQLRTMAENAVRQKVFELDQELKKARELNE